MAETSQIIQKPLGGLRQVPSIRSFVALLIGLSCTSATADPVLFFDKEMSRIVLSRKAAKLMRLCDLEGFRRLEDLPLIFPETFEAILRQGSRAAFNTDFRIDFRLETHYH